MQNLQTDIKQTNWKSSWKICNNAYEKKNESIKIQGISAEKNQFLFD